MENAARPHLRLLEVLAPLSLAIDLGMGAPDSWVMRSSILSRALAESAGMEPSAQSEALYVTLLRHLGCSSTAELEAKWLGDEQLAHEVLPGLMDPTDLVLVRQWLLGPNAEGRWRRTQTAARVLVGASQVSFSDLTAQHCSVARKAAQHWRLGREVETALDQSYERWDGRGQPRGLSGEDTRPAARIAGLALDIVRFYDWGGLSAAVHIVRQRRGTFYQPALADLFLENSDRFLVWLDQAGQPADLLAAEPTPHRRIAPENMEASLATLADFADAQTSDRHGWSARLRDLVGLSADLYLTTDEASLAVRASLVQGLGRLTVGASVWARPGPLRATEWERVRLVPHHCERILARTPLLAEAGRIAGQAFERLNGSGYPRGLRGSSLSRPSRLLASATVYQALTSDRPYRRAFSTDQARTLLLGAVSKGELDADSVAAVLGSAEGRDRRAKVSLPFELTPRELDVLKLIALGLSNKAMAAKLGLAPRTIDHHVERLYSKIHVHTRASAAQFAFKNSLVSL